jgi:hypothetical protein
MPKLKKRKLSNSLPRGNDDDGALQTKSQYKPDPTLACSTCHRALGPLFICPRYLMNPWFDITANIPQMLFPDMHNLLSHMHSVRTATGYTTAPRFFCDPDPDSNTRVISTP